jgi:hypothetical protein
MSALSDYAELKLLDHMLKSDTTWSNPGSVFIALATGSFSDDATGTELSGNGYARKEITFGSSAASGSISNTAAVEFAAATGSWGTVSHFAIFDASTSGNMLVHGALTASKAIGTGDVFKIAISGITVTAA